MRPSTFVISLTPFDEKRNLDEEALRGHFRRLAAAGIGVYVGGGGSGEGYTLSEDEIGRVLQIAVEELKGHVPVRDMGVEPRTALQMIERARRAEEIGLDAVQIYSLDVGHDNKPNATEMEEYLSTVLEGVTLPCVISTHFSVGWFYPIELLARMLERHSHVIGINCTNPDITHLIELVDRFGRRAEIHVGGPMQGLTALALGATGFLTSEGNLAPRLCVAVVDHFARGELAESHREFARLLRLFAANMRYQSITGMKGALQALGLPGGYPRPPRQPLSAAERREMLAVVDALGLRESEGLG